MTVARARAVAQSEIPDTLFKGGRQARKRLTPIDPQSEMGFTKEQKDEHKRRNKGEVARSGLDLERLETACKAKPRNTRGDGNARPFVPWCKGE